VNNTDGEAQNPDCKPKFDINCKLVPQIWLVDWNVIPKSTTILIQEHVALGEIWFCIRVEWAKPEY